MAPALFPNSNLRHSAAGRSSLPAILGVLPEMIAPLPRITNRFVNVSTVISDIPIGQSYQSKSGAEAIGPAPDANGCDQKIANRRVVNPFDSGIRRGDARLFAASLSGSDSVRR